MPYAVSAGRIGEIVVLDLNKIEDNYSEADMPVAISPRTGNINLLQMDGILTREQFRQAIGMVKKAGETITRIQKEALIKPYQEIAEKYMEG
jgi:exosome complex component RRP41